MRERRAPLRVPKGRPNWFEVDVPGQGVHLFRVPRALVIAELQALLGATGFDRAGRTKEEIIAAVEVGDLDTTAQVRASEEGMGACIGEFWRHTTVELETSRQSFSDDLSGLRRYGNAVMEELDDHDYSIAAVKALMDNVGSRLILELAPSTEEVKARSETFPDPDGTPGLGDAGRRDTLAEGPVGDVHPPA